MFHWIQVRKYHLTCNVSQCFTELKKSWGKNTWHVMFLNQPKSPFMTAEHSRQRLLTQYPVHKVFKLTTFSWYKLWKDLPFSNITLVKIDYWWKLLNFLTLCSDYWHNFGFTKLSYWPWASSGRCKPGKYILFSHLTLINLITLSID